MNNYKLEQYVKYIRPVENIFIDQLRQEAIETDVPIIRHDMEDFIKVFININKPRNVLEIGTAIGFSSIIMANEMKKYESREIVTIERSNKMYERAVSNIKKAKHEDFINIIHKEAMEALQELEKSEQKFDMIFMDSAKAQYITFLPMVKNLLKKDGVLITDNVLIDGDLVKSRFNVKRRNRTIHKRMREYLYEIMNDKELLSSILNIGDGITLSYKKREEF